MIKRDKDRIYLISGLHGQRKGREKKEAVSLLLRNGRVNMNSLVNS